VDDQSTFLKHIQDRNEDFKPNPKLTALIAELRDLLEPVQLQIDNFYTSSRYPVVLIVGSARSGTTLLTQILSASGAFAYPSNLMTRFAYAPYIGARIQQLLLDSKFDYRGELGDIRSSINYSSILGRSKGALAVNEFFHFWRRFLPYFDPQFIPKNMLNKIKMSSLRAELASIESVFDLPFMGKGMMLQFNIPYFVKALPKLFIINIKRDPLYVMQSIYKSRMKYYGNINLWWSVKPSEYNWIKNMDPIDQIAGQVYFTEKGINKGLKAIDSKCYMSITYDQVCNDPVGIFTQLSKKLYNYGYKLSSKYDGKKSFKISKKLLLPNQILDALVKSYERFKAEKR
jgi:hypothetical protein